VHPSDDEAWKHFNSVHPHFSAESKNVCLGLCTYGFNPFGDMYKAGVHVFIYGHTRSEQSGADYRCLSLTVD
jgi:hypothetical protein